MSKLSAMNVISPEDLARADYYAVLSRLFFAPPDAAFLAALAAAGKAETEAADLGELVSAWNKLCTAAAQTSVEAAQEEYAALFIGIGKPQIVLYASWHLTGFMMEKPLARLRDDLAELGLSRIGNVLEPEDHFAALMDAMRHLLIDTARGQAQRRALQHQFFTRHVSTWYENLCDAIDAQPNAQLYRSVSACARIFFGIEKMCL